MKDCLFWLSGIIGASAILIVLSSVVSLYFAYSNYTLCLLVLGVVSRILSRFADAFRPAGSISPEN